MIDHISLQVQNLKAATAFYRRVLEPLGYQLFFDTDDTAAFGTKYPQFWLNHRPDLPRAHPGTGAHVCLRAPSDEAVSLFHASALELGGTDDGAPGPRQALMTRYFGAFIRDLDGNRVEAVCFPKKAT